MTSKGAMSAKGRRDWFMGRLRSAFRGMREAGVVAADLSCCGTCGAYELAEIVAAQRGAGNDVLGYAFYHSQEADHLREAANPVVHIHYDALHEAESLRVGRIVAEQCRAAGLAVDWPDDVALCVVASVPPAEPAHRARAEGMGVLG